MHPQRLRKAELLPLNEAETRKALEDLHELKGPFGEQVISVAVRQAPGGDPITTIVYQSDDGRHHLGVLDEKGKPVEPDFASADEVAKRSPEPKKQTEK